MWLAKWPLLAQEARGSLGSLVSFGRTRAGGGDGSRGDGAGQEGPQRISHSAVTFLLACCLAYSRCSIDA